VESPLKNNNAALCKKPQLRQSKEVSKVNQSMPSLPVVAKRKQLTLLSQMDKSNFHLEKSKHSSCRTGVIRAFAANTHQGLVRNYNEDTVSIIVNVNNKPAEMAY
jgi:protein phosphatase 2C family protein 2/3